MGLGIYIRDYATRIKARVTNDHALLVTSVDRSGFETTDQILTRNKLYRDYMRNGTSKDMVVDGSTTPVLFEATADEGKVLYITSLRLIFHGEDCEMNTNDFRRFGPATAGGAALPNGITLTVYQGGVETDLFANPIVYMGDFFQYTDSYINLVNSVSSQSDFLSFTFYFEKAIVLPEESTDRLELAIRDDLTDFDLINALVQGYQEVR